MDKIDADADGVPHYPLTIAPAHVHPHTRAQNGVDPVFWHRALYAAYISLMNAFFWIPKEEEAVPPALIDQAREGLRELGVI